MVSGFKISQCRVDPHLHIPPCRLTGVLQFFELLVSGLALPFQISGLAIELFTIRFTLCPNILLEGVYFLV